MLPSAATVGRDRVADNPSGRLDGWKAIAAHFGRNRSTVMRWAEAGDLPVRRMLGKKSGSVWAFAHELDAWLAQSSSKVDLATAAPAEAPRPVPTFPRIVALGFLGATVAIAVAALALSGPTSPRKAAEALPSDPAVADLYLQARDDASSRTPDGLAKATAEFGAVTARDPNFAPAYAGLAEAYILSREFGSTPDAVAFPRARAAAEAALGVDPSNPDVYRDLGFLDYWQSHDLTAARRDFGRSLKLAPGSAQTHLWFGNVLTDADAYAEGLNEMRLARLLNPGSIAIQMDYAWARWRYGPGDAGLEDLEYLASHGPQLAATHRYLAMIALSKGDIAGYLDQERQWAALQARPDLDRRLATETAAFRQGGARAVLELIAQRSPTERIIEGPSDLTATAASLLGHRERLLAILEHAEASKEHWGAWRPDQIRFSRWRGDPALMQRLERVSGRTA